MGFSAYSYDIASTIKFNNNYGRIYFTEETAAVNSFNQLNTIMAPGCQAQLARKLVSYDKRSLPAANMKDCVRGRITFYNSADPTKQLSLSIPGIKPVMKADGVHVDVKATVNGLYTVADDMIIAGISMADGTLLDQVLSCSIGKVSDITQQDSTSTART